MSVPLWPFICDLLCHWCYFYDPEGGNEGGRDGGMQGKREAGNEGGRQARREGGSQL